MIGIKIKKTKTYFLDNIGVYWWLSWKKLLVITGELFVMINIGHESAIFVMVKVQKKQNIFGIWICRCVNGKTHCFGDLSIDANIASSRCFANQKLKKTNMILEYYVLVVNVKYLVIRNFVI